MELPRVKAFMKLCACGGCPGALLPTGHNRDRQQDSSEYARGCLLVDVHVYYKKQAERHCGYLAAAGFTEFVRGELILL
jgi:predicted metal-binding protein